MKNTKAKKLIKPLLLLACAILLCLGKVSSVNGKSLVEGIKADTTKPRNFAILPLIFSSPETSLGFGAGATYSFNFKNEPDSARPSQLTGGAAYTLNKQLLTYLSFQLFKNNGQYKIYGEIGYYRYVYDFYGVGNDQSPDFREVYGVNYPRIRLNALRETYPNLFLGFRYWFDDFQLGNYDPEGQLIQGTVTGSEGGIVSQAGVVVNYDSRNNVFYPSKGWLVELVYAHNSPSLGSDFTFNRWRVDAAKYWVIRKNDVIALNFFSDFVFGNPPFNEMGLLGGTKRMRGFYEGRYRDNHALVLQAEYRLAIFQAAHKDWLKRFKLTFFGSYGGVAPEINAFQIKDFKYTLGAGLRFRLTDSGIHLRLDYGVGNGNSSGLYVTFGEAF